MPLKLDGKRSVVPSYVFHRKTASEAMAPLRRQWPKAALLTGVVVFLTAGVLFNVLPAQGAAGDFATTLSNLRRNFRTSANEPDNSSSVFSSLATSSAPAPSVDQVVDSTSASPSPSAAVPPVFVDCPAAPLVVPSRQGKAGATVYFGVPVVLDATAGRLEVIPLRSDLTPGSFFPIGTHSLGFQATNPNGVTVKCVFDVVVQDAELPVFVSCPASQERAGAGTEVGGLVVEFHVEAVDNSKRPVALRLVKGQPSGSKFPLGKTNVVYKATDAAGNVQYCKFSINIIIPAHLEKLRSERPAAAAPASEALSPTTGVSVHYGAPPSSPSSSDGCDSIKCRLRQSPALMRLVSQGLGASAPPSSASDVFPIRDFSPEESLQISDATPSALYENSPFSGLAAPPVVVAPQLAASSEQTPADSSSFFSRLGAGRSRWGDDDEPEEKAAPKRKETGGLTSSSKRLAMHHDRSYGVYRRRLQNGNGAATASPERSSYPFVSPTASPDTEDVQLPGAPAHTPTTADPIDFSQWQITPRPLMDKVMEMFVSAGGVGMFSELIPTAAAATASLPYAAMTQFPRSVNTAENLQPQLILPWLYPTEYPIPSMAQQQAELTGMQILTPNLQTDFATMPPPSPHTLTGPLNGYNYFNLPQQQQPLGENYQALYSYPNDAMLTQVLQQDGPMPIAEQAPMEEQSELDFPAAMDGNAASASPSTSVSLQSLEAPVAAATALERGVATNATLDEVEAEYVEKTDGSEYTSDGAMLPTVNDALSSTLELYQPPVEDVVDVDPVEAIEFMTGAKEGEEEAVDLGIEEVTKDKPAEETLDNTPKESNDSADDQLEQATNDGTSAEEADAASESAGGLLEEFPAEEEEAIVVEPTAFPPDSSLDPFVSFLAPDDPLNLFLIDALSVYRSESLPQVPTPDAFDVATAGEISVAPNASAAHTEEAAQDEEEQHNATDAAPAASMPTALTADDQLLDVSLLNSEILAATSTTTSIIADGAPAADSPASDEPLDVLPLATAAQSTAPIQESDVEDTAPAVAEAEKASPHLTEEEGARQDTDATARSDLVQQLAAEDTDLDLVGLGEKPLPLESSAEPSEDFRDLTDIPFQETDYYVDEVTATQNDTSLVSSVPPQEQEADIEADVLLHRAISLLDSPMPPNVSASPAELVANSTVALEPTENLLSGQAAPLPPSGLAQTPGLHGKVLPPRLSTPSAAASSAAPYVPGAPSAVPMGVPGMPGFPSYSSVSSAMTMAARPFIDRLREVDWATMYIDDSIKALKPLLRGVVGVLQPPGTPGAQESTAVPMGMGMAQPSIQAASAYGLAGNDGFPSMANSFTPSPPSPYTRFYTPQQQQSNPSYPAPLNLAPFYSPQRVNTQSHSSAQTNTATQPNNLRPVFQQRANAGTLVQPPPMQQHAIPLGQRTQPRNDPNDLAQQQYMLLQQLLQQQLMQQQHLQLQQQLLQQQANLQPAQLQNAQQHMEQQNEASVDMAQPEATPTYSSEDVVNNYPPRWQPQPLGRMAAPTGAQQLVMPQAPQGTLSTTPLYLSQNGAVSPPEPSMQQPAPVGSEGYPLYDAQVATVHQSQEVGHVGAATGDPAALLSHLEAREEAEEETFATTAPTTITTATPPKATSESSAMRLVNTEKCHTVYGCPKFSACLVMDDASEPAQCHGCAPGYLYREMRSGIYRCRKA
eukprot:GHVT01100387.1.p1 GENE.GHVT01100387.1~~GHVT01100387.1.p1  ORF type:complete len:1687 (-),score=396.68 GHVT01100387.1:876-5936(-)